MDTYINILCMGLLTLLAGAVALFLMILAVSGVTVWWRWMRGRK